MLKDLILALSVQTATKSTVLLLAFQGGGTDRLSTDPTRLPVALAPLYARRTASFRGEIMLYVTPSAATGRLILNTPGAYWPVKPILDVPLGSGPFISMSNENTPPRIDAVGDVIVTGPRFHARGEPEIVPSIG